MCARSRSWSEARSHRCSGTLAQALPSQPRARSAQAVFLLLLCDSSAAPSSKNRKLIHSIARPGAPWNSKLPQKSPARPWLVVDLLKWSMSISNLAGRRSVMPRSAVVQGGQWIAGGDLYGARWRSVPVASSMIAIPGRDHRTCWSQRR